MSGSTLVIKSPPAPGFLTIEGVEVSLVLTLGGSCLIEIQDAGIQGPPGLGIDNDPGDLAAIFNSA